MSPQQAVVKRQHAVLSSSSNIRPRYASCAVFGLVAAVALLIGPGCEPLDPLPVAKGVYPDVTSDGVIDSEDLDIHGQWYVYGDAYGSPKSCTDVGYHAQEQCSSVAFPETHLPSLDFPNAGGKMCISGVVAQVINCCTESAVADESSQCTAVNEINCFEDNGLDFSSMWGAGLGFDLDLHPEQEGVRDYNAIAAREPWNADQHRVIGISFHLEWHASDPPPPLRVEFPIVLEEDVVLPEAQGTVRLTAEGELTSYLPGETLPAGASTEEHPYGSPFWQEEGETEWKRSPIEPGENTVLWEDVFRPPVEENNYMMPGDPFPVDQMLGVQFHVIPDSLGKSHVPFSFCISQVKFLTE